MHVLTLNIEHLGIGWLGPAGLYTAAADIARMLGQEGVRVSEVWWNEPASERAVVATPVQPSQAFRLLADGEVTAIYTQYVQTGLVFEVAAHAWPRTVPIVSICHDLIRSMDVARAWLTSPARHRADAVVMSSPSGAEALRTILAQARPEGVVEDVDIEVIPLGTFLPEGVPPREEARRGLGWSGDDVVFLHLGRFSDRYKADLRPLLLSFRELLGSVPQARLAAVGADDRTTLPHLRRFADELGIAPRCEWFPDAPEDRRNQCLAGADVLVNTADHPQETFGISIVEAMSCGLPVIASDWSGFRDLVRHGETGLLVPTFVDAGWFGAPNAELFGSFSRATFVAPAELLAAMRRLATDGDERRRMGKAGRARVAAELCWRVLAPRYVQLFEDRQLLAAGLPPRPSPRRWMEAAFGGFGTARLSGRVRIAPGSTPLDDVLASIADDELRAAACSVGRDRLDSEDRPWPSAAGGEALAIEHAALMLLLKYGVLRVLPDGGAER